MVPARLSRRLAIWSRSPMDGNGHHHDRHRPSSSVARPGTTLPESTRNDATSLILVLFGGSARMAVKDFKTLIIAVDRSRNCTQRDHRYLMHAARAQRIDDVGCFVGEYPGRAAEQCV